MPVFLQFFFKIISLITPPPGVLLCNFFIFHCTWTSLQIFMKSFFYKKFLWPKISRVSSFKSASTLLWFQGHFMRIATYLEKQTAIYVFLCISLMKRQVKKESFSKGCKFHLPVRSTTWFLRLLLCAGVFRKAGSDIILRLGCRLQSWKGQVTHLPLAKLDLSWPLRALGWVWSMRHAVTLRGERQKLAQRQDFRGISLNMSKC